MQLIGGAYNIAQPQEHIPVEESQSEYLTQKPCDARNPKPLIVPENQIQDES